MAINITQMMQTMNARMPVMSPPIAEPLLIGLLSPKKLVMTAAGASSHEINPMIGMIEHTNARMPSTNDAVAAPEAAAAGGA
jgi:hypothetical protein